MKKLFLYIVLIYFGSSAYAQNTLSGKMKKTYWDGETLFESGDLLGAIKAFKSLYSTAPNYPQLNYYLGDCYFQLKEYNIAVEYLKKAKDINDAYFELAYAQLNLENILAAKTALDEFTWDEKSKFTKIEAKQLKSNIANYNDFIYNQEVVNVINLGKSINTSADEYVPLISSNEELLLFTSRRKNGDLKDPLGAPYEDIYYSTNSENGFVWLEAKKVEGEVNTALNDACVGLSPDGNTMYLFRTNKNLIGGDLYESIFIDGRWTTPVIMSRNINGEESIERSASISLDGLIFYFSSNRSGGYGGFDIYKVIKLPNGQWSEATNLGKTVNTPLNEDAPFIHPDGKTLYFSSEGFKNMGGFDIFKSDLTEKKLSAPQNLGTPTNTTKDDIHFTISANEKHGYYSTNKAGGFGGQDIYAIDYLERSLHQSVISAEVTINGVPAFTEISLIDLEGGDLVGVFSSHPKTGKFIFLVNPNVEYELIVEGDTFKEYSEILSFTVTDLLNKQKKYIKLKGDVE